MPAINRIPLAKLALALVLGFATPVALAKEIAEDSGTNAPTFASELRNEILPGLPTMTWAYVTFGTNRFAFLLPRGYRIQTSPEKLNVTSEDYSTFISIRVLHPAPDSDPALERQRCREIILDEHPGSSVLSEFTRTVDGVTGPAFDVHWKIKEGSVQTARAAYIPSPAGVMEFELISHPSEFRKVTYKFNNLLLTFRASHNGKLEVAPLSNKF